MNQDNRPPHENANLPDIGDFYLPEKQQEEEQLDEPIAYVGIGASAGGLEALEQFFRNMSADTGLTFVVVQHLAPDYKSLMVELLSRHTPMKVFRAEEGISLQANCIYLIPPKKNMTIKQGHLHLTDQNHNRGLNLPIDIFLRSLAQDQKNNAIGIILSGTGSDGSLGLRAIKEVGGMVMVQDERSAKFDGMPKSAIATGLVDYILPPEQMPTELKKFMAHPYINKQEQEETEMDQIDESFLTKVVAIIRNRVGVDFSLYKPNTIIRRLERRISINQIQDVENYIQLLQQSPYEVKVLYKEILIGVTQFFRDPEAFELLKREVIPDLFENRKEDQPIRLWSAACSTGEEAYSLAILLHEYMEENKLLHDVKIFASDLDKEALEYASLGTYPESIASDVAPERLLRYFEASADDDGTFHIREDIRRMVIFAHHNLIKDPPFSKIDMVSCRNLLIYLKPEMQQKVLSTFHFSLKNKGYLFLGSSENLGSLADAFSIINGKWKIYQYKDSGRIPVLGELLATDYRNPRERQRDQVLKNQEFNFSESVSEHLLGEFVPPGILVDENNHVVHFFRNVDRYVHFSYGKATFNVLKLVRPELSMVLSGVLHKVKKAKKDVVYKNVHYKDGETPRSVNIIAKYIRDKRSKQNLVLVVFEEGESSMTTKQIELNPDDMGDEYRERLVELEKQLQYRDENLQTTVEELETSNEELQATNEELIASNEELQSTNEELQSVNEELYTVNSEYQNKIQELTALNNDINNLLNTTKIGTLYLDRNLCIRKYTSHITTIFSIKDIDLGRPIHDFSFNAEYDYFFDDVKEALEQQRAKEIEIADKSNNWHLLRIFPYFTDNHIVTGVIVSLIDITDRKLAEESLVRERKLLMQVLDDSPIAKITLNAKGEFTYFNQRAGEILETDMQRLKTQAYNKLDFEIFTVDDKPMSDEELPFSLMIKQQKSVYDIIQCLKFKDGQKKYIRVNGSPMFDHEGEIEGGVFSFELIDPPQTN